MTGLLQTQPDNRWLGGMQQVLLHVCITALAIGIALSLPAAAQYILYQWWPKAAVDANLMIATEIGFAAALVVLFNLSRIGWQNRHKVRVAELAALVHARQRNNWLARWREKRLVKGLPAARDACILTLTGLDTFADDTSLLHGPLRGAYEIRVLLLNPAARGAARRVDTLPRGVTLQAFTGEVRSSIAYLESLRAQGKKVTLRFYDEEPFWKVVVLGDHVWVQFCHDGVEIKHEPEYVFALNPGNPRHGLFVPFYRYFLDRWSDPAHPEYDFDSGELVYRDALGREAHRAPFGRAAAAAGAVPQTVLPGSVIPQPRHVAAKESHAGNR